MTDTRSCGAVVLVGMDTVACLFLEHGEETRHLGRIGTTVIRWDDHVTNVTIDDPTREDAP